MDRFHAACYLRPDAEIGNGALAVARARQVNKPGLARRLMERLRAIKAGKRKD
jgi:bifunctional UDP-N-acetylglucosamine pyrophosphorylase/glucosamine-1-phosphate N-acetyltransferase